MFFRTFLIEAVFYEAGTFPSFFSTTFLIFSFGPRSRNEDGGTWSHLPVELKELIWIELLPKEVFRLALVCKTWHHHLQEAPGLYQTLYAK